MNLGKRSHTGLALLFLSLTVSAQSGRPIPRQELPKEPPPSPFQEIVFEGKVRVIQGDGTLQPVRGARVDIYTMDGSTHWSYRTDETGRWTSRDLSFSQKYIVSISGPGIAPIWRAPVQPLPESTIDFTCKPGGGDPFSQEELLRLAAAASHEPEPPAPPAAPVEVKPFRRAVAQLIQIRHVFSTIFSFKALARHHSPDSPVILRAIRVEPPYISRSLSASGGRAAIDFQNNTLRTITKTEWRVDVYDEQRRILTDTFYLTSRKLVRPGKTGGCGDELGFSKTPYSPAALAQIISIYFEDGSSWEADELCEASRDIKGIDCKKK